MEGSKGGKDPYHKKDSIEDKKAMSNLNRSNPAPMDEGGRFYKFLKVISDPVKKFTFEKISSFGQFILKYPIVSNSFMEVKSKLFSILAPQVKQMISFYEQVKILKTTGIL